MSYLSERLEEAKEFDFKMKDVTVLDPKLDPYRLDTPANHARGQWFRDAYLKVHTSGERIHLRGLHYKFVGNVLLPDGAQYINTDKNWEWLQNKAAKPARYLGYIPWDAIRDARNAPPEIRTPDFFEPKWFLNTGEVELEIPEELEPKYQIYGDMHRQPWRQVIIAEKQGVQDLLLPLCERRQATLCLPSGEVTDTLVYDLLHAAAEDGRPLAIHQLGDFDPAGYQMAVSTARKVQALVDTQFFGLQVIVHAPALTLEQCQSWNLPETPLKETEQRADKWAEAMGWNQTELDAAVALAPEEFVKAVDASLLQYFDPSLYKKGRELKKKLEKQVNDELDVSEILDTGIQDELNKKLGELEDLTGQINDALAIDPDDIDIEAPEAPEAVTAEMEASYPLIDTNDSWIDQTLNLINRKQYR